MLNKIANGNLMVTMYSSGLPEKVVPLALEMEVTNNAPLYNTIMDLSEFNTLIEKATNYRDDRLDMDSYSEEEKQKIREYYEKLRKTILNGKPKITIKIELETYEQV